MDMKRFILYRLLHSVFVLLGLSILIFVIARVVPGDPVRIALGARAPEEVVESVREEMFFDRPLHVQYGLWLQNTLKGDFGRSLYTRRPVLQDIKEFLPATLELALVACIIMTVFGILLGTLAAQKKNSMVDNVVRLFAYFGVVTPPFVFSILFLLIFGFFLEILPTAGRLSSGIQAPPQITGLLTIDSLLTGNFKAFFNAFWHLLIPSFSLAMAGLSQQARITRSTMSDNLQKDYIQAHKIYGIPGNRIMFKYLLKPSLIPTVSILGLDTAALMANAFLVEMIVNWPGLSRYGINAILRNDLNAITSVVMVLGLTFVIVNIVVDIVVAYLDPRIRLGREKA